MSERGAYSIRLKGDTAVLRAAGFKSMEEKAICAEGVMGRFYALKAVGGCKYLRVEMLSCGVNDFPDFGQNGVVQAVFDFINQY